MSAAPVLSVRDLCVGVAGGSRVVDHLSFDVGEGETLCLVGESGSGKSVTALSVMGLLPPGVLSVTGGAIRLGPGSEAEDLAKAAPARMRALRASRMSMIFQEPMTALNPVLPVGRQIAEALEAHGEMDAGARRARVVEIMDEVHLPEPARLQGAYPHQLSGGQRQRVMIAMALVLRPALLIADEPTTALDVTTQRQILALIRELRESRGTAVLFITHDMGVVSEIADEVAVLRDGALQEVQPVDRLLRAPRTDYARALLEAVPSLVPREPRSDGGALVVLETRGLAKTYREAGFLARGREVHAASDVDLSLRSGRTLGIVGESGSGKSTVARCIVRLIDPSAGSIRVAGEEIATLSRRALKPHRRRFQIVFQDPFRSLNPRLRVADSITEGPTNFGVPRAEAMERARELMELVHLPPSALERFPHQFSGGQRQRIAIARALAMEPDLLIADEAVSALDVSVQAQVLRLLDEIQTRLGVAILFITHDLRVAAQICDEVMVMQRGRIVEAGPAAEVLGRPRADYTRALIEAAPGRHWDFARFRPLTPEREAVPVRSEGRERMDIAGLPFDADEMLAGLRPWVECESPTFDAAAVNRMMDLAAADLGAMGAEIERIPGRMGLGDCLRARLPHPLRGEPGLLVMGHLDTVHPVGTLEVLPFERTGDVCHGPGICDMKGGNYAALEAWRQLARAGIETPLPVTMLLTSDEEIGTPANRALIEDTARGQRAVLVPEPGIAGGGMCSGRYAIARYDLRTVGRPSHAGARLSEGRSAIAEMARRILQVEAMTDEDCTFSVGVVHAGRWVNCVSSEARAEVLSMAKRQDDLDRGVERMLALADPEAEVRFEVARGVTRPVWEPSGETLALVERAAALAAQVGVRAFHKSQGGGSDGNFTGAMGIPTLDGLGVEGDGIHTLEEHIRVETLAGRGRVLAGLMATIA